MKNAAINENVIAMHVVQANNNLFKTNEFDLDDYLVVHPLFDKPEEKVNTDNAEPLVMSKTVKWSLIALRGYLVIMIGLAFYRVLVLAGIF